MGKKYSKRPIHRNKSPQERFVIFESQIRRKIHDDYRKIMEQFKIIHAIDWKIGTVEQQEDILKKLHRARDTFTTRQRRIGFDLISLEKFIVEFPKELRYKPYDLRVEIERLVAAIGASFAVISFRIEMIKNAALGTTAATFPGTARDTNSNQQKLTRDEEELLLSDGSLEIMMDGDVDKEADGNPGV